MSLFHVFYRTNADVYGPSFVQAESMAEARDKFAGKIFMPSEARKFRVVEVQSRDIEKLPDRLRSHKTIQQ